MTTNKDFKNFLIDIKKINEIEEIDEGLLGTALKFLGPAATVYQGYEAYQRLKKGDYPGAALSAAGAIPGPVGWAAIGADYARGSKDDEPETPKEPEAPKAPEPTSDPIVARKVQSTVEKESGGKKIKSFKQFNKNK